MSSTNDTKRLPGARVTHGQQTNPAVVERILALVREGLDATTIANRVGGSAKTVKKYAKAAGLTVYVRRLASMTPEAVAEADARNVAGESVCALSRSMGYPETTLRQQLRALRQARYQAERRAKARAAAAPASEPAPEPPPPRRPYIRDEDDIPPTETAAPSPAAWISDLQPRGRRLVLELVDAGMGDPVLVARLEELHAAPPSRCRCRQEERAPLAQESWVPSSATWASRALMLLAGIASIRSTDIRDHDGGRAK